MNNIEQEQCARRTHRHKPGHASACARLGKAAASHMMSCRLVMLRLTEWHEQQPIQAWGATEWRAAQGIQGPGVWPGEAGVGPKQAAHPVLRGVAVDQAAGHDGARERPALGGDADGRA